MRLMVDSDMAKLPGNCHMCYLCLGGYCPIAPSETDGCCADEGRPEWCPLSIAPEQPEEVIRMTEVCADNRFEIIADYKRRLVEGTNIETKPEEMAVLDSILFRFWQMGWLKEQQAMEPRSMSDCAWQYSCGECKKPLYAHGFAYCPWCGRRIKWQD